MISLWKVSKTHFCGDRYPINIRRLPIIYVITTIKHATIHTHAFYQPIGYSGVNYNRFCTQNAKSFSILAHDSHYFGVGVKSNENIPSLTDLILSITNVYFSLLIHEIPYNRMSKSILIHTLPFPKLQQIQFYTTFINFI